MEQDFKPRNNKTIHEFGHDLLVTEPLLREAELLDVASERGKVTLLFIYNNIIKNNVKIIKDDKLYELMNDVEELSDIVPEDMEKLYLLYETIMTLGNEDRNKKEDVNKLPRMSNRLTNFQLMIRKVTEQLGYLPYTIINRMPLSEFIDCLEYYRIHPYGKKADNRAFQIMKSSGNLQEDAKGSDWFPDTLAEIKDTRPELGPNEVYSAGRHYPSVVGV